MSPAPIPESLRALPRADLVGAPTPIQRLERFEKAIDSPYPVLFWHTGGQVGVLA